MLRCEEEPQPGCPARKMPPIRVRATSSLPRRTQLTPRHGGTDGSFPRPFRRRPSRSVSPRPWCSGALPAGAGSGRAGQGHGDPLGPLRHPSHLRARSSEPLLRLRLRPDGGPRRAAGAPLCTGAGAGRGVLRGAVSGRRRGGADDGPSGPRQANGRPDRARSSRPSSRPSPPASMPGRPRQERPERRGAGGASAHGGGRLRPRVCASSSATGSPVPRRLEQRLTRYDNDVHGSNEWAIAPSRSASGKAPAVEQLAPAVGRYPHRISRCS